MTVLSTRLAKLEKAWTKNVRSAPSKVTDEELRALIAGHARNYAKWMPLETARRIAATIPRDADFDEWTDAQLEAYIVVLDSRI